VSWVALGLNLGPLLIEWRALWNMRPLLTRSSRDLRRLRVSLGALRLGLGGLLIDRRPLLALRTLRIPW
jgi:hypothetical protein